MFILERKMMDKKQSNEGFILLDSVSKRYSTPAGDFYALRDITLNLGSGSFVAIVGKSGSGKSTLINLIAGIDRADQGDLTVGGVSINGLSESKLARWRGINIGVVFQFFQLLPALTVLENIMLPMDFCGTYKKSAARERAYELLDQVGIREQALKLPSALSGGQQQRAAIARALANDPGLIVADEPTGNLDSQTSQSVLELLLKLASAGKTVLMVTHEKDLSQYAGRVITLADGRVVSDSLSQKGAVHV